MPETEPTTTVNTVGVAPLAWGTHNETYGYAENVTYTPEADIEEVKQGDGTTVGLVISNPRVKVSVEWTPIAGATLPIADKAAWVGAILTITEETAVTWTVVVTGGSVKYTKGKAMTYAVEGTYWPSVNTATTGEANVRAVTATREIAPSAGAELARFKEEFKREFFADLAETLKAAGITLPTFTPAAPAESAEAIA